MEIKCELCGEMVVVADGLVLGQHVRCPFCGGKFSYAVKPKEITEEDLREAIAICRKSDEWNKYYKNAPAGAKLYIALVFYGKVFASTLDKAAFVEAFKGIGTELKERDLRYLLQHEDDEAMREYLSDRLASVCGGMGEAGERALAVKPSQSLSAGGTAVSRRVAKPAKVLRMRNSATLDASCRMNAQSQTNWTGVVAAVVVALAVVCAGIFLYRVWAERQEGKERAQTEEVARIKALEDKRKQLNDCVNNARSEVNSLQKKLAVAVTVVDDDKARFKNEMTRIETENNLRAGSARTKGRMRFNAAELAMAIFESLILGDIYERYMEQSLAGKAAEAKTRILAEIGGRSTFSQDEVDGIDVIGNAYVKSANKEILNALDAGRKKVEALKEEVKKLKSVVRDADYIAQGTDTRQMDVAIIKLQSLQYAEVEKRLDRFVVPPESVPVDVSTNDEFVIDNSQAVSDIVITDDLLREAGIDPVQFRNADLETRKQILVEMHHDIEMRRRRFPGNPGGSNVVGRVTDHDTPPQGDVEPNPQTNNAPPEVVQPQLRKCHKCLGMGAVAETVNEKCEDCEGRGYIVKEVIIKDTKFSTDGCWNYRDVGSRVSKSRQNCERCKHRGKITVKREKVCPACKGSGYFTKDGMPYKKPKGVAVENADGSSQWLIPTAEKGGAIWHYLKFEPERSWIKPGYDHSKWFDGRSAFAGRNDNLVVGTEWNSQDIYLRKRFKFDGDVSCIKVAKLRYTIDDNLQVWLNGEKIAERSGVDEDYREIDVTKELVRLLRKGDNVIAAWAHDYCGRRNVDIGLYVSRRADKKPWQKGRKD